MYYNFKEINFNNSFQVFLGARSSGKNYYTEEKVNRIISKNCLYERLFFELKLKLFTFVNFPSLFNFDILYLKKRYFNKILFKRYFYKRGKYVIRENI